MSFLSILGIKKKNTTEPANGYWAMFGGYNSVYTTFDGGLYEMELTRSCVNTFATQCSKLQPVVSGTAGKRIESIFKGKPNPFQTTSQFIRRTATAFCVNTTAFIFPICDKQGKVSGFFSALPQNVSAWEIDGELWYKTAFCAGEFLLAPASEVGVLTDYQYKNDLFGDGNAPLKRTLDLLNAQNAALESGIRNSSNLQFMARIEGQSRPEVIKEKRELFAADEIDGNKSGIMLYDNTFAEVRQLDNKQWTIDTDQYQKIRENAFAYFGTNDAILQNKASESEWQSYNDAKIEPFAIQLSEVITAMVFSASELSHGNSISFRSDSLDFMPVSKLLTIGQGLVDRGVMSRNELRARIGLPKIDGGDEFVIRGEYISASKVGENTVDNAKESIQKTALNALAETEVNDG